jgi:L-phenylalanine/L-methionine N-acetyltransferase
MSIIVRAARLSDYAAICETMSQPLAQAMTLQLPLPTEELWKKRLENFPDGDFLFVAELDGRVVGNLGLHAAHKSLRRRHVGALGMSVHDAFVRRGIGLALMQTALNHADNWLQYTRLELQVYTDNAPAIALYHRCGFEIEGTHRRHAFRNGEYVDSLTMARIKM